MNEWRSEEALVRYYCTAGCGMERFLIDEVKHKLAAEDVSVYQSEGRDKPAGSSKIQKPIQFGWTDVLKKVPIVSVLELTSGVIKHNLVTINNIDVLYLSRNSR